MTKRVVFFLLCLALLGLASRRVFLRYFDNDLRLTFFDVGQGDAALVRLPGGRTLLVDAGGGWREADLGTRELFPELARMGILKIDLAILSHPDQDHAYGLRGVFRELGVGEFLFNALFETEGTSPLFGELQTLAREKGIRTRAIGKVLEWTEGPVRLKLIPLAGKSSNDRSLVLFVERGACRVLFTGDLEAAAEAELAQMRLPSLSLLKVAHHGSKTSTTEGFLSWAKPRWAVISVGARNHYGHPHPWVLSRLRHHRVQVLRTDFHGYVQFRFSGAGDVSCETALGQCGTSHCDPILDNQALAPVRGGRR